MKNIIYTSLLSGLLLHSSLTASTGCPNPYCEVPNWAIMPDGVKMSAFGDLDVDPTGEYIWAVHRVGDGPFGSESLHSKQDPILKFDKQGNVVDSFGGGMFIWPHGIEVDPDGNIWVTDGVHDDVIPDGDKRGHAIYKFTPEGELLMTIGTPGTPGTGDYTFTSPADIAVADNGDIFVVDGHFSNGENARILKYNSEGKFITSWGTGGYAPGELRTPHGIDIDKRGRVFIADRGNNRLQLFTQDGEYLASWTQFGKPSGVFFDENDMIYVSDSESDNIDNPGWQMGIRIGEAELGWVYYFIPLPTGDPRVQRTNGAEFVAVDNEGSIYSGEPDPKKLKKYIRVRP